MHRKTSIYPIPIFRLQPSLLSSPDKKFNRARSGEPHRVWMVSDASPGGNPRNPSPISRTSVVPKDTRPYQRPEVCLHIFRFEVTGLLPLVFKP